MSVHVFVYARACVRAARVCLKMLHLLDHEGSSPFPYRLQVFEKCYESNGVTTLYLSLYYTACLHVPFECMSPTVCAYLCVQTCAASVFVAASA